jgi:hypothetical protein
VAADLAGRRLGIVDEHRNRVDDFPHVVRRDVGRHPDCNAGRAVDDEVGNPRRQHLWLLQPIIEVRREIDGILVDVGEHLHRDTCQPRFGVPVGGRRIAIDGAEVPLPIDERIPQGEVLHHAHEGVVYRRVAVRVVLA